jgi:hypothetical protein
LREERRALMEVRLKVDNVSEAGRRKLIRIPLTSS